MEEHFGSIELVDTGARTVFRLSLPPSHSGSVSAAESEEHHAATAAENVLVLGTREEVAWMDKAVKILRNNPNFDTVVTPNRESFLDHVAPASPLVSLCSRKTPLQQIH